MNNWSVEMLYTAGITVANIQAETRDEAIEKAKKIVECETRILSIPTVDVRNLEFDQVTYVQQES